VAKTRVPRQADFPEPSQRRFCGGPGQDAVATGGHDIPEPVIRRRFEAGQRNFRAIYRKLVDSWVLYDNSVEPAVVLDQGERT
jgi:hypothetical protein